MIQEQAGYALASWARFDGAVGDIDPPPGFEQDDMVDFEHVLEEVDHLGELGLAVVVIEVVLLGETPRADPQEVLKVGGRRQLVI